MASPNETKLPEQQYGNSDHTAPSIPTPGEISTAATTQEGVQGSNGAIAVPVTHAHEIETNTLKQPQGELILDESHPAVTNSAFRAVDQQPQALRENAAVLPVLDTKLSSINLASDEGKGSDLDDGESETLEDDGDDADSEYSDSFDDDQEPDIPESSLEPIHPASDINPDNEPENGAVPGFTGEENRVDLYHNLEALNLLKTNHGRETSIRDNMLNYGDIERLLDGRVVQDFPETISDEEAHIAEAIRVSKTDQATPSQAYSAAEASSSQLNGENSASVTGPVAESDSDKVVPTSPLVSVSGSGDNNDAPITASTDSEQSDGGNSGPVTDAAVAESENEEVVPTSPLGPDSGSENGIVAPTTASTGPEQTDGDVKTSKTSSPTNPSVGEVEHSIPATPALTSSPHSEEGKNDPMTPKSISFSKPYGSSVAAAPTGFDRNEAEDRRSETAIPTGSEHMIEQDNDPVPPNAASEPEPPVPSAKSKGKQREPINDELPTTSVAPVEATSSNPTNQASIQNPTAMLLLDKEVSNTHANTVHLRIQYRLQNTLRHKPTICVSAPPALTLPSLKTTILTSLLRHNGIPNPRPIKPDAEISRLVAVCWVKKNGDDGHAVCNVTEFTNENVGDVLGRLADGCGYDVVKVEFVPGTNGEVRGRKKSSGKVYGKAATPGGL